jgi:hypothetical protein
MLSLPAKVLKKFHTFASNPVGVYYKYVGKMKAKLVKLRGGVPPVYGENYDRHWNFTSFEDKVVLELGADYGSTAYYFLGKGAKRVIAVEGDAGLAKKLASNFKKDERVIPISGFIEKAEQIDNLILSYHPDIVKVDIEGNEKCLLDAKRVDDVKEWLIEAHTEEAYRTLCRLLAEHGFRVRVFNYLNHLKILHATKVVRNRRNVKKEGDDEC